MMTGMQDLAQQLHDGVLQLTNFAIIIAVGPCRKLEMVRQAYYYLGYCDDI